MKYRFVCFTIALLLAILIFIVSGNGVSGDSEPLPHYPNTVIEQVAKNYAERKEEDKVEVDKRVAVNKQKIVKEYWNVPLSLDLQRYIRQLCKEYGVDEQLAYAVMKTESNFNSNLISSTNDWGLFQINQINHDKYEKELGVTDWLNPYQNSMVGIKMLSELKQKYGDNHYVLTAYNRGEGAAQALASRSGVVTSYSRKVLNAIPTIEKLEVGE